MSKLAGTVHGDELWLRCPACGDSKRRQNVGHFSINLRSGAYHCVRCGYGGHLTPGQFAHVALSHGLSSRLPSPSGVRLDDDRLLPASLGGRRSLIERHVYTDERGGTWDAFPSRDAGTGERIGWYLRSHVGKHSLFSGERGLGWSYGGPVHSTPAVPVRLVEGPYDVITEQDVCCFGLITQGALQRLGPLHTVILCPDGDVWADEQLRTRFVELLRRSFSRPGFPAVDRVEILPADKDPDDVPVSLRKYTTALNVVKKFHRKGEREP